MKRVLVVEDELSIATFLTDVIHVLGHESKVMTSGRKVLETVKEWKPNLITLDIMMPSPDGIEVMEQIKNDPETSSIPIFIVSVVANDAELSDKLSKAQGVFQKPLETKLFIDQVRRVISET